MYLFSKTGNSQVLNLYVRFCSNADSWWIRPFAWRWFLHLARSGYLFGPVCQRVILPRTNYVIYQLLWNYIDCLVELVNLVDLDYVWTVQAHWNLYFAHEHVGIFDLCLIYFFDGSPWSFGTSDSSFIYHTKGSFSQFLTKMRLYLGNDLVVLVDILSFKCDEEFLTEFEDILFHIIIMYKYILNTQLTEFPLNSFYFLLRYANHNKRKWRVVCLACVESKWRSEENLSKNQKNVISCKIVYNCYKRIFYNPHQQDYFQVHLYLNGWPFHTWACWVVSV